LEKVLVTEAKDDVAFGVLKGVYLRYWLAEIGRGRSGSFGRHGYVRANRGGRGRERKEERRKRKEELNPGFGRSASLGR
jgi:hypothetical protein